MWWAIILMSWGTAASVQLEQRPPIRRDEVARETMTAVWEPRIVRDVEYARVGNLPLQLDLYVPPTKEPHPLVVWIHGGAFLRGDKARIFWTPLPGLTQKGYAVASVNYRLSSQAVFPALVQDVKAAIRWLRANAARYELKADRIVVAGESAGGYLSVMLGTTGGVESLEDLTMGNPRESSRVQGVVDFFGPSDFLQMDAGAPRSCQEPMVHNDPQSPESRLLGCKLQDCPDKVKSANPITYVTRDDPPFLIFHGTSDCLVAPNQSQLLSTALKRVGVRCTLHLLPNLAHADPRFVSPDTEKLVNDFLSSILK
jgi:acetyl esterase/lipase